MKQNIQSLRSFVGSQDFQQSRSFYRDLGFQESQISTNMSYFHMQGVGFYLQDYYVKDWMDNLMLFLEIDDVQAMWDELQTMALDKKYPGVRYTPIKVYDWGRECFVHDPSGALWHFGQFW